MPLGSGSLFAVLEDFSRVYMYTACSWDAHVKGLAGDFYECETNSTQDTDIVYST